MSPVLLMGTVWAEFLLESKGVPGNFRESSLVAVLNDAASSSSLDDLKDLLDLPDLWDVEVSVRVNFGKSPFCLELELPMIDKGCRMKELQVWLVNSREREMQRDGLQNMA